MMRMIKILVQMRKLSDNVLQELKQAIICERRLEGDEANAQRAVAQPEARGAELAAGRSLVTLLSR